MSTLGDPRLEANCVRFAHALRRLGVPVTQGQIQTWLHGLTALPIERRHLFKNGTRAALVNRPEDLARFERLFDLFWHRDAVRPREIDFGLRLQRLAEKKENQRVTPAPQDPSSTDLPQIEADIHELVPEHSRVELLRHKDFAQLTDGEAALLRRYLQNLELPWPPRRSRRLRPSPRGGSFDFRRVLKQAARHGGEAVELPRRHPKLKPRPIVVLCDVSGSMETYSRIFLQFAYALGQKAERVETFVFGTRLTRISRELGHKHVDRALTEAVAQVVDWGGGTRIGESFRTFNRFWGRRVLGRGAVVLVVSDAWDRGEAGVLGRETERLAKRSSRLIWLNPLIASEGYEPTASGIRAVLPHLDDFLPIHNLHSLESLAEHLGRLS